MRILLLIAVVLSTPVVGWAEYHKTPGTPIDLGELTSELKSAVPALEGCDDIQGTITCRRLKDDFTTAEQASMDAAIAVHDPGIREKRKAQQKANRKSAIEKLETLGITKQELDALGFTK